MEFASMEEAVARVRANDSLAVPLGPGVPSGFLHALGERDDFAHLEVFGALLPDLYQLFMRKGVRYRSGFFGPAERFLRDSGAEVLFTGPETLERAVTAVEKVGGVTVIAWRSPMPKTRKSAAISVRIEGRIRFCQ